MHTLKRFLLGFIVGLILSSLLSAAILTIFFSLRSIL